MVVRIALLCSWLLLPLSAAAQPRLRWQAPAECPQESAAKLQIARALGRPWGSIEAKLALAASIRGVDGAYEARIRIGPSRAGERVLRDADCAVLARAAGVVMALAIEPETTDDAAAVTAAALEEPAPPPVPASAPTIGGASKDVTSDKRTPPWAAAAAIRVVEPAKAPPPSAAVAAPSAGTVAARSGSAATDPADEAEDREPVRSARDTHADTGEPITSARAAVVEAHVAAADVALGVTPAAELAAARRHSGEDELAMRAGPPAPRSAVAEAGVPLGHAREPRTEAGALQIAASVAGSLSAGVLPKPSPGARVSVSLLGPGWRAGLRLGYTFPQSGQLSRSPAGGRISLASFGADAGPRFQFGRFEVPVVGGLETGFFDATGEAVDQQARRAAPWLSTYLGTAFNVLWSGNFALGLRVEGFVSLLRPGFAVRPGTGPATTFYRPEALGVRGFLELELRFQ